MNNAKSYDQSVPDANEFLDTREKWRTELGADELLRSHAIKLVVESNKHSYGYQWEWCGVPIIRHPDDIVLQQEIMWNLKPTRVIETGVARGGSLVLSASLMSMIGTAPKVLGLDIQILPHAHGSLKRWTDEGGIELFEGDSTSDAAISRVKNFINNVNEPCLLILDSNHSHEHVLRELNSLATLLPIGSIVIVADTIVEEMPENYYPNRPWGRGNNPYTAVQQFLQANPNYVMNFKSARRSLMGECRDGILRRNS
jgi:cephalosporin hydroxylase